MISSTREEIQEDFDALRAAVSRILGHSYDALTTPERLALLERLEQETRRLRVPGHQLINQLAEQALPEVLGAKLSHARWVSPPPTEESVQRDTRSPAQRNHDGRNAECKI